MPPVKHGFTPMICEDLKGELKVKQFAMRLLRQWQLEDLKGELKDPPAKMQPTPNNCSRGSQRRIEGHGH